MKKGKKFQKELEKFSTDYEEEIQEMIVLTAEHGVGASSWEDGIWKSLAEFLASVNSVNGSLYSEKGRLCWLVGDEDRGDWIFDLKPLTIYRIKCRRLKAEKKKKDMPSRWANEYMLVEVVERGLHHELLEKVLEEYKKPVVLTDELCGKFELERAYNCFSAELDWLGEKCSVMLECDDEEDGETAEGALAAFREIYANRKEWDQKFRAFAAKELTELANEWQDESLDDEDDFDEDEEEDFDEDKEDGEDDFNEDEEEDFGEDKEDGEDGFNEDKKDDFNENGEDRSGPITEELFASRIYISEFSIDAYGEYTAYYEDDDMFFGHVILIAGSLKDGMESADIAG